MYVWFRFAPVERLAPHIMYLRKCKIGMSNFDDQDIARSTPQYQRYV